MKIADDILIYIVTIEQHDIALADIFLIYFFDQPTVEYYGCSFLNEEMRKILSKINALKESKRPRGAKGVKSFLGLANYLKRFINDYSTIDTITEIFVKIINLSKHSLLMGWKMWSSSNS